MGTLINGIKEIFASASQTSPTNIPTCAADGTPNGNITIANLASVLGVVNLKGSYNDSNIDQKTNIGYYSGWSDTYGILILLVYQNTNGNPVQIEFSRNSIRYRYYAGSWTEWDTAPFGIPSFYKNYSDLASLASALGVLENGTQILSGTFADITKSGIYGYNHDSYTASDEPANYGVLMVFNGSPAGGGNPIAQMFFASNGTIYTRIKSAWTGNDYTAWRTISFT